MKLMRIATLLIVSIILVSCGNAAETVYLPSSSSQSLPAETGEPLTPLIETTSIATPVATPTPNLLLYGMKTEWFDWDAAGAPPLSNHGYGVMVTSDEESIYYPKRDWDVGKGLLMICKADRDGCNETVLDEYEAEYWEEHLDCYLNYYGGWLYYSIDDKLFRIQPDGNGKALLVTAPYSMDFLVVDDQIYINSDGDIYKYQTGDKLEKLDGGVLTGYDNGRLYYIRRREESPNILCAYDIKQGTTVEVYSEDNGWLDSFLVYNDKIYFLRTDNQIYIYDVLTGSERTVECPVSGEGWNIAAYDHFLVIVSSGMLVLFDIKTEQTYWLCSCPSYISAYSTRCGIYFYREDVLYILKNDNGQYSVVPL